MMALGARVAPGGRVGPGAKTGPGASVAPVLGAWVKPGARVPPGSWGPSACGAFSSGFGGASTEGKLVVRGAMGAPEAPGGVVAKNIGSAVGSGGGGKLGEGEGLTGPGKVGAAVEE